MFLDKFRNRYSFNFLSVCGWIILGLLCVSFFPYIFEPQLGFPLAIIFIGILGLNLLFYIITFFVYVFETVSLNKISSEKFLNNKYVKLIQNLGIVFAFLPILILILFFTFSLIKSVVYNFQGIE